MANTTATDRGALGRLLGARSTLAVVALLLALRVALAVRSGGSEGGRDWDFTNFYNAGARVFHGELATLYAAGGTIAGKPALGSRTDMVYTGFPVTAFELWPIGGLEPDLALHAFKLGCALCYAGALFLLYPWFRARWPERWPAGATLTTYLLLALACEPIWFTFRVGGQTTPFALLGIAAFLRAWQAERRWLAAFCYCFAVLNKPFLGVGALVFLVAREWGLVARCAAWGAGAGALSLSLFGLERHREWLRIVGVEGGRFEVPWSKNAAPLSFVNDFWLGAHGWPTGLQPANAAMSALHTGWKVVMLGAAILAVLQIMRGVASAGEKRVRLVLIALLLPLAFSTVVWSHYLAFAFPLLMDAFVAWPRLTRGGRWLTALAWLGLARANWTLVDGLRRLGDFTSLPAIAAVALLATLTLLALVLLHACERKTLLGAREPGDPGAAVPRRVLEGATPPLHSGRA